MTTDDGQTGWAVLKNELADLNELSDFAYRGQGADFGDGRLLSSLDRVPIAGSDAHKARRRLEWRLWRKFERDAPSNLALHDLWHLKDPFYRWALMRHLGIPTRLLDWTESVWIAAYFACTDAADQDGCVWAFCRPQFELRADAAYKGETQRATAAHYPANDRPILLDEEYSPWVSQLMIEPSFPNMLRQQGFFTTGGRLDVDHWHAIQSVFSQDELRTMTRRVLIPKEFKPRLLDYINRMGINGMTLFAGIEGVVRFARDNVGNMVSEILADNTGTQLREGDWVKLS